MIWERTQVNHYITIPASYLQRANTTLQLCEEFKTRREQVVCYNNGLPIYLFNIERNITNNLKTESVLDKYSLRNKKKKK